MKAPDFWQKSLTESIITRLLQPAGKLYGRIVQKRLQQPPHYRSTLPVICVGNITMGGSGKTPVVQAITRLLQEQGAKPAILLRGYGGKGKGSFWVTQETSAAQAGDEALLHARIAPTLVSADRVAGAKEIERCHYTHIIMDDGLQNPSLAKTLSLLVMDGGNPFGNGLVFPAGPLRETLDEAIPRVQAIIVLGDDKADISQACPQCMPVFLGRLQPIQEHGFRGQRVIAFAGIGRPAKFFNSLRQAGAEIVEARAFPDHHPYQDGDLAVLQQIANDASAQLVTTRKDWVRLPLHMQQRVAVLDVAVTWDDPDAVQAFLQQAII